MIKNAITYHHSLPLDPLGILGIVVLPQYMTVLFCSMCFMVQNDSSYLLWLTCIYFLFDLSVKPAQCLNLVATFIFKDQTQNVTKLKVKINLSGSDLGFTLCCHRLWLLGVVPWCNSILSLLLFSLSTSLMVLFANSLVPFVSPVVGNKWPVLPPSHTTAAVRNSSVTSDMHKLFSVLISLTIHSGDLIRAT